MGGIGARLRRLRLPPPETAVAVGMVVVSILGSLVTWRATIASDRAESYDERAIQDLVLQEERRAYNLATVDQDARSFALHESHILRALELERAAEGAGDAALADRLTGEAQEERALAAELVSGFISGAQPELLPDGNVRWDPSATLKQIEGADAELARAKPERFRRLAAEAHRTTTHLAAVAALFVGALFFLTMSQLTGGPLQRPFRIAGAVTALAAAALFPLA